MEKRDRLLEIFHAMLGQPSQETEDAAQLIQRVTVTYALELCQHGDIPGPFRLDVMADLESEVTEMYRKKTYGFFSLQEYRNAKRA